MYAYCENGNLLFDCIANRRKREDTQTKYERNALLLREFIDVHKNDKEVNRINKTD